MADFRDDPAQSKPSARTNFGPQYQTITVQDDPKHYYDVVSDQEGGPEAFDAILMRKDPPFNMDYNLRHLSP